MMTFYVYCNIIFFMNRYIYINKYHVQNKTKYIKIKLIHKASVTQKILTSNSHGLY